MADLQIEIVGEEPYQCYPLGMYVVHGVGVCGGRTTFKYTRIEVAGALERFSAGETVQDLVRGYQGRVSADAIREAIHYGANTTRMCESSR